MMHKVVRAIQLRCLCDALLSPVNGAGENLVIVSRTCECGRVWDIELECVGFDRDLPVYRVSKLNLR